MQPQEPLIAKYTSPKYRTETAWDKVSSGSSSSDSEDEVLNRTTAAVASSGPPHLDQLDQTVATVDVGSWTASLGKADKPEYGLSPGKVTSSRQSSIPSTPNHDVDGEETKSPATTPPKATSPRSSSNSLEQLTLSFASGGTTPTSMTTPGSEGSKELLTEEQEMNEALKAHLIELATTGYDDIGLDSPDYSAVVRDGRTKLRMTREERDAQVEGENKGRELFVRRAAERRAKRKLVKKCNDCHRLSEDAELSQALKARLTALAAAGHGMKRLHDGSGKYRKILKEVRNEVKISRAQREAEFNCAAESKAKKEAQIKKLYSKLKRRQLRARQYKEDCKTREVENAKRYARGEDGLPHIPAPEDSDEEEEGDGTAGYVEAPGFMWEEELESFWGLIGGNISTAWRTMALGAIVTVQAVGNAALTTVQAIGEAAIEDTQVARRWNHIGFILDRYTAGLDC